MSENRERRCYLAECYWPGVTEHTLDASVVRVRLATIELRRQGRDIRLVTSILVPADETVFWLFDGDEADVRSIGKDAGIAFERVLESLRINGIESSVGHR